MKSPWPVVFVVAALAFLRMTQANSDEPGNKARAPAADPMRGKEPGEVRDDSDLKMKLVWCPPGEFVMGIPKSEKHVKGQDPAGVTLTTGFWLGKYEVTQSEWKQVMQTEPWKGRTFTKEGADYPATLVGWNDATEFCRKLTERERQAGRLPDEWEYTLPTDAQWEYACRARSVTRFSFGDDASKLGEYEWFYGNTWNAGERYPHQVGQKKPNRWGLHDMHGNVWEWCRDVYTWKLPGGRDPEVVKANPDEKLPKDPYRVIRGGLWLVGHEDCRSWQRTAKPQDDPAQDFDGFRVALGAVQPVK
jgi:formylglycine-generating enzyme required for sulfatase activity